MKTAAECVAAHAKACEAIRNARNLRELLNAERAELKAYLNAKWQDVEIKRFNYAETPVLVAHRVPDDACDVWRVVPRDE